MRNIMRNIIVVECISTGKNYIGDIVNRGYNPIVLHLKDSDTEDGKKFGQHVSWFINDGNAYLYSGYKR